MLRQSRSLSPSLSPDVTRMLHHPKAAEEVPAIIRRLCGGALRSIRSPFTDRRGRQKSENIKIRRIIRRNLRYEQTCTHYRRKPRDRRRMRPRVPRTRRPGRVYLPKPHRKCRTRSAAKRERRASVPTSRTAAECPVRSAVPLSVLGGADVLVNCAGIAGIFPLSGHHRRDVGENDLHRSHGSLPRIARGIPIYDIREIGENSQRLVSNGARSAHRARYTTAPPRRG